MPFYEGQRLSYDGALCTVRFFGPLKDLKRDWVGVEWDNTARGKHDGQHQGEQIFQCLSSYPTAASFIRPTRKPDPSRTLLEAIKRKYAASTTANGQIGPGKQNLIEISGKTVEVVGFEKIQEQISHLADLKIALVDELNVTGVANDRSQLQQAQDELAEVCPSISELDIGWNAIETWQDVADICLPLKKLRTLKSSGLRLRSFHLALQPDSTSPFELVEELHLNECLLKPTQILQLLSPSVKTIFPSLKTLWLSQNELTSFRAGSSNLGLDSVTTLILENNKFTSLDPLQLILTHFPNTTHLSLQGNLISAIGATISRSHHPNVTFLNIGDNGISDFTFIDTLPTVFPNLTSLRISRNPLYDQNNLPPSTTATPTEPSKPAQPSDSSYYLTLARLPNLKTLNYTNITTRDREEGEIYYLSVAEKRIGQLLASPPLSNESAIELVTKTYPLYSTLCTKYDRPNILESPLLTPTLDSKTGPFSGPKYAPGTLGARLVTTTFYILPSRSQPDSKPTSSTILRSQQSYFLRRPLPPSMSVYTLKSLLSRHFGLAPLSFKLIYETGELDPINETTTKLGLGKEGWEDWGDWDVDVRPEQRSEHAKGEPVAEEKWIDHILHRDGVRWRKREIEILDGMRGWGDYLENGVREATIRIEPFNERWEDERGKWRREDLWDVIGKEKGVAES